MPYIEAPKPRDDSGKSGGNPFIEMAKSDDFAKFHILWKGKYSFIVMNKFPYNCGHLLVLPLREIGDIELLEGDEKTGATIVLKSIEEPLKQIAINAGLEGSVIVQNVKTKNQVGYGYNALTDEYGDMISFGIVDPTKVTRSALENAASVASMVLTTEAIITDKKEPENNTAPGMPAGGMGGMY